MASTADDLPALLMQRLARLHGENTAAFGTPEQTVKRLGSSLDDRINDAADAARELGELASRSSVVEFIEVWRRNPIRPTSLPMTPASEDEQAELNAMFDAIVAGTAELGEAPTPVDEAVRYHTVKRALERQRRWPLILDEVLKRAGLST